jgi:hypothetical protein
VRRIRNEPLEALESLANTNAKRKRNQQAKWPELEKVLVEWVAKANAAKIPINNTVLHA